jgi:hypothetical protein
MYDVDFDFMGSQPARQPETVASGFIRDDKALNRASALNGLVSPPLKEP